MPELSEILDSLPEYARPGFARDWQAEQDAEQAVRVLARALVALSAPVWRWGNGYGGWVHLAIAEAAAEIGLPIEAGLPSPPSPLAEQIARRDGGFYCAYCSTPLMGSPEVPRTNIDHVIPKALGGSNKIENLVLACAPCNRAKGALTVEEFIGRVPCD